MMKTNLPLISCIVPVYNAAKYLHRCLNSVISQDYPVLEIILIDDGSVDCSGLICDEYSKKYDNIIVKHIENVGASLARRLGLEIAKGEYITFVDADDFVTKEYLSAMYEALKKFDTLVSGCGVQCIKLGSGIKEINQFSNILLQNDSLMNRFFNYEFWGLCGGLYHKSVFSNIVFPKATLSEDYYIKCQMFLKDCKMAYADAPLYVYEKHEGSLSNTKLSNRAFEEFENVNQVYELTKHQMPQYASLALKNVVETCVKLLLMGKASQRENYKNQYNFLRVFLASHTLDIAFNSYILIKVKILALCLRYCPWSNSIFNRL